MNADVCNSTPGTLSCENEIKRRYIRDGEQGELEEQAHVGEGVTVEEWIWPGKSIRKDFLLCHRMLI